MSGDRDALPAAYHLPDLAQRSGLSVAALLSRGQEGALRLSCRAGLFARHASPFGSRWSVADDEHDLQVRWTPPEGSLLRLATWAGDLCLLIGADASPVRALWLSAEAPPELVRDALVRKGLEADPAGFELRGIADPDGIPVALGDLWIQHEDAVAAGLLDDGDQGDRTDPTEATALLSVKEREVRQLAAGNLDSPNVWKGARGGGVNLTAMGQLIADQKWAEADGARVRMVTTNDGEEAAQEAVGWGCSHVRDVLRSALKKQPWTDEELGRRPAG